MPITQHDRDRLEDLGIDPEADRTEDLRKNCAADTANLGGSGVDGEHTTTHLGAEVHKRESTQLFHGATPLHGSAADTGTVNGVAQLSVTTDDVELVIVDGTTARGIGFVFTPEDWSRLLGLIDRSNDEPLPLEVTFP